MGTENTPPASPGIPVDELTEEMFEDEVEQEIDVGEGQAEGDLDEEDEDDLVELPGGIDQLEALIEEHEQTEDNSRLVFDRHKGSVFCCSLWGGGGLAVTGGEDDKAFVWRLEDGAVEQELVGWGDSVTCAAWSKDSSLLAIADMGGNLRVLRCPGYEKVWSFEVSDVLWLRWHPVANVLFCGTVDSQMWMWKMPGGDSKVFTGAGGGVDCGEIIGEGKKAICGFSDGSLRVFDLKTGETLHALTGAHKDNVNCVVGHPGRELALSGGMDGVGMLWNTNTGKQAGMLLCGEKQEENSAHSVECVLMPEDKTANVAVTGSLAGTVAVWDLSSGVARTSLKVGEGVTVLRMGDNIVYCGTLEGEVRSIDIRTGAAVAEYGGHRSSVLDMQIDSAKGVLLTAGDDGTARVYDIRVPS